MRQRPPIFRRLSGSRTSALTATALAATLTLGTAIVITAAAAPPLTRVAAAAPACTPVTPESLTAQVTQPVGVWGPVGITFSGTLYTSARPANLPTGACVVIPSSPELPLRTYGSYEARDPNGAQVGGMHVDASGITFTFLDSYLSGHTDVTFGGRVEAGISVDTSKATTPSRITWRILSPKTDVVVNVPACPNCGTPPDWGYKYAVIDARSSRVYSGVVFGQKDWWRIPGTDATVELTISDQLGAGHTCNSVTLFDMTNNPPDGQYVSSNQCPASVTFNATRGHAYKLAVNSTIDNPDQQSYTDTGRVTYKGGDVAAYTATALWADAAANGDGRKATPTTTTSTTSPTVNPGPTPTTTTSTTTTTVNPGPTPVTTPSPTTTLQFPQVTPTPSPQTTTTTPSTTTTTTTTAPSPSTTTRTVIKSPLVSSNVLRTFQVDRLTPRTAAQAALVARLDDDGLLRYREDKPLWRVSHYQMITLSVPVNASPSWIVRALNARTTKAVGDLVTTRRLPTAAPGGSYLLAWELGRGATVRLPWGANTTVSQRFFGRG